MPKRSFIPYRASELSSSKRARVSKPMRSYIARTARQTVLRLAEKKHLNTQIDEDALNSLVQGSSWYHLSAMASGVTAGNRIGKEAALHSVEFKGVLHNSSGTHLVRVVLGYVEDEVVPSNIYDLFEGVTGAEAPVSFTAGAAAGLNAMYQPLNRGKFTVLYDQVHKLGAVGGLDGAQVKFIKFKKNLRNARSSEETLSALETRAACSISVPGPPRGADVGAGTGRWSGCATLHYTDM